MVSHGDLLCDLFKGRARLYFAWLRESSARPFFRGCGDEEFMGGVRQHDRADVSSFHNDQRMLCAISLLVKHPLPDFWDLRCLGDDVCDGFRPDVFPVDWCSIEEQDKGLFFLQLLVFERPAIEQLDEFLRFLVRVDIVSERFSGDRPVHFASIDIKPVQLLGQHFRCSAFSRSCRSVDGDLYVFASHFCFGFLFRWRLGFRLLVAEFLQVSAVRPFGKP